jgi:hypothetical protein
MAQAPPIIDTIIVDINNVFTQEEAAGSWLYRSMNSLHIQTRPFTVRRELGFVAGDMYDPALTEESERKLRSLQIFGEVAIDTATVDGRFAVTVRTQDGWSLKPKISFQVATDGNVTYNLGVTELNLLGTANLVHAAYRKDVDRTALDLSTKLTSLFRSSIGFDAQYENFSDGRTFNYLAGDPFRGLTDAMAFTVEGENTDRRMLQYRVEDMMTDTTAIRRQAQVVLATGGWALSASPDHYLRVGGGLLVRNERFSDSAATGLTDSISSAAGVFLEWRNPRFITMRRFNGFVEEDIDASTLVHIGFAHTPRTFGYEQNGWGPILELEGTVPLPRGFLTGAFQGHGIFDDSGLDSGLVEIRVTAGFKPGDRHAAVVHGQIGAMKNQTPGNEFDLGFVRAPRSWAPHAFVGDRSAWVSAEYKYFVADALFGLLGVAVAGFVDYGGAWYDDQPARYGGNIGFGLRTGSALATIARTGRIDVGYLFGDGVTQGNRWVLTIGSGFVFGGGRDPSCVPEQYQVRYRCRGRF